MRSVLWKHLLIFLLLDETVERVLFTLGTTFFIKAHSGETLSSRTGTLFSSNLPVTRCKTARLEQSWVLDHSLLIGMKTHRLCPTVICWSPCRHKQTIDYVTAQILDPFPQNFISLHPSNIQNLRTMKTKSFSNLQVVLSFSEEIKINFFQFFERIFLWELNLLKGTWKALKDITWQISKAKLDFCF